MNLCDRALDRGAERWARITTSVLWRRRAARGRPHGLPGALVVSLTSYPPRFGDLDLTLKGLLSQSIRPDRLILWIAACDMPLLPAAVRALARERLEIRSTPDDTGPYKKIAPALLAFPAAFIATADDDACYPRRWLEALVSAYDRAHPAVVCHRARRVRLGPDGNVLPYAVWEREVGEQDPSPLLLATGVGGVLYYPGALPPEAAASEPFLALAPRADDLWLYWMERRVGALVKTLGSRDFVTWRGSQRVALHSENTGEVGMNDVYLARLTAAYGAPLGPGGAKASVASLDCDAASKSMNGEAA